jgi:hypothetical protein
MSSVHITSGADGHLWTIVRWVPTREELPDDDMTVLIITDGEVWTGFLEGGAWHYVSGDPVGSKVTYWCEFPEVPA